MIQHLDFVYRAWSDGSTVFHLCLDLKGAYDRVIRQKLLEILVIFGFPRHLLLFMYSYSRGRGVKIRIPGFTSEEVLYVFLGIFQGSPLSALLFAFYTTPILEYFMRVWEYKDSVQRMLWAFADDFSLMARVFKVPGKAAKRRLDLVSQGIATAHNDLIERFGHHGELRPQSSPDTGSSSSSSSSSKRPEIKDVRDLGIQFGADKYQLLHYRRRDSTRITGPVPLPDIDGLPEKVLTDKALLLGVMLDSRLTFEPHVRFVSCPIDYMYAAIT